MAVFSAILFNRYFWTGDKTKALAAFSFSLSLSLSHPDFFFLSASLPPRASWEVKLRNFSECSVA